VRSVPLDQINASQRGPIYVLVPDRLVSDPTSSAALGTELSKLERTHRLIGRSHHPNVDVWEYR
jgi:hypothetical protein